MDYPWNMTLAERKAFQAGRKAQTKATSNPYTGWADCSHLERAFDLGYTSQKEGK